MLYLTRKPGEGVWIGDKIRVVVRNIEGGKVSLAFEAPKDVTIDRDEVRQQKRNTPPPGTGTGTGPRRDG